MRLRAKMRPALTVTRPKGSNNPDDGAAKKFAAHVADARERLPHPYSIRELSLPWNAAHDDVIRATESQSRPYSHWGEKISVP